MVESAAPHVFTGKHRHINTRLWDLSACWRAQRPVLDLIGQSERVIQFATSTQARVRVDFAAVHASIHNRFNQDRHLNRRDIFKQNRSVALAEWRQRAA